MMDFVTATKQLGGKSSAKLAGKGEDGCRRNPNGCDAAAGAKERILFKNCYECGIEDHQNKGCAERWRIIGPDGKPPAGQKTARDEAWKKYKAKSPRKPTVNQFGAEEPDTEPKDEDFDPMTKPFVSNGTSWAQALQHSIRED